MEDPVESVPSESLKQNMHVVRHDAPSNQRVSLAVEPQQRLLYESGNFRDHQIAPSIASIESRIDGLDTIGPGSF
jgi:hypothetical protein